jgi:hypothetical protein
VIERNPELFCKWVFIILLVVANVFFLILDELIQSIIFRGIAYLESVVFLVVQQQVIVLLDKHIVKLLQWYVVMTQKKVR